MAEHIASRKTYILVWAALMVLTVFTVFIARLNLGPFNDIVALAVAVTKAILVILFFMHVKDSSRLTRLTVVAGFCVVSARNPVHSVLWLILAFFSAAGLFVLMGAEFLAMLLVVVYVGAVAVLSR